MKINIGNIDKYIRIGLAILIFTTGLYFGSWWGFLGFIPLFTGLINSCPLYSCVCINTCDTKK